MAKGSWAGSDTSDGRCVPLGVSLRPDEGVAAALVQARGQWDGHAWTPFSWCVLGRASLRRVWLGGLELCEPRSEGQSRVWEGS